MRSIHIESGWLYWIRGANKILSLELLAKFTFFLTNNSEISLLLLLCGFYTEGSIFEKRVDTELFRFRYENIKITVSWQHETLKYLFSIIQN